MPGDDTPETVSLAPSSPARAWGERRLRGCAWASAQTDDTPATACCPARHSRGPASDNLDRRSLAPRGAWIAGRPYAAQAGTNHSALRLLVSDTTRSRPTGRTAASDVRPRPRRRTLLLNASSGHRRGVVAPPHGKGAVWLASADGSSSGNKIAARCHSDGQRPGCHHRGQRARELR
jgi:hypothetical protein